MPAQAAREDHVGLECVATVSGSQLHHLRHRVAPKPGLGVRQAQPGLEPDPPVRGAPSKLARGRSSRGDEVPHPQDQRPGFLDQRGCQRRKIAGQMLPVGIHRDGVAEPPPVRLGQQRPERDALALVPRVPEDHGPGRLCLGSRTVGRAVVADEHRRGMLEGSPHHVSDGRDVVEDGNDDAGSRFVAASAKGYFCHVQVMPNTSSPVNRRRVRRGHTAV